MLTGTGGYHFPGRLSNLQTREGGWLSCFPQDNRNVHGYSWERLSLVTDSKAKAAGPESSAQTPKDPGLGLHREGTWCGCPRSPLSVPVTSIQGNQVQQGAWRSRAPSPNVKSVTLPFCLQAKRKAKVVKSCEIPQKVLLPQMEI